MSQDTLRMNVFKKECSIGWHLKRARDLPIETQTMTVTVRTVASIIAFLFFCQLT